MNLNEHERRVLQALVEDGHDAYLGEFTFFGFNARWQQRIREGLGYER